MNVPVDAVVYPESFELKQEGLPEPLVVFGHDFVAGLHLPIREDVAPGTVVIPGCLRYQACDDKVCYAPATAQVEWTVRVVASLTAVNKLDEGIFKICGQSSRSRYVCSVRPISRRNRTVD